MAASLHFIKPMPTSPRGQVERATGRVLLGPDLMANLFICEIIIANPWQAKAFVKAVKKRLQNKNSKVQFLALTLLETMMQKCGDVLHFQVVDYEILQEMVKIVRKTRNMQVRDKILQLLETWQEAFGGLEGKYPQYYYTYAELKRSGVRFPLNPREDGDLKLAPFTQITNQSQVSRGMPTNSIEKLDEIMESETGHFSMSGLNLDNVRSVIELFNNMLQVVNPIDHQAIKDEVITDLADQCSKNQKKLMQLINSTENDGILREALALNDSIQTVLSKHNALVSGSTSSPEKPPILPKINASVPALKPAMAEDEVEDGFSYIAKRNSVCKSNGDQEVSSSKSEINTATPVSATEGASSIASNALILFDPPEPASSPKKEEDMIDLLSLTLPENQSSQTDPAPLPSPPSNPNQNPFYDSPPIMSGQNQNPYNAYNNYIAPWSQPAIAQLPDPYPFFPQQLPQYPADYPPMSWSAPGASSNPFQSMSSTQTQYPASQPSIAIASAAISLTSQGSKGHRNLYSFGSIETQFNADQKQTRPSSAPKPYMPDNLFEDLIELRNPDGSLKSRNASSLWALSGSVRR